MLVCCVWWPRFLSTTHKKQSANAARYGSEAYRAIKEVWVTGHFPQLHDHIHESCLALLLASKTINCINVLFKHATVPLSLHIRQANINVDLLFYGDTISILKESKDVMIGEAHWVRDSSQRRSSHGAAKMGEEFCGAPRPPSCFSPHRRLSRYHPCARKFPDPRSQ